MSSDKNKLFIPEVAPRGAGGCPDCGAHNYSGSMTYGVLLRKCRDCGREWAGGLPQVPQDPSIPMPPESYVPTVSFGRDSKGEVVELRRRPDHTQAYRKGAKIPEGDE